MKIMKNREPTAHIFSATTGRILGSFYSDDNNFFLFLISFSEKVNKKKNSGTQPIDYSAETSVLLCTTCSAGVELGFVFSFFLFFFLIFFLFRKIIKDWGPTVVLNSPTTWSLLGSCFSAAF